MGRHARVLSLIEWSNGFWYYRLPGMKGYKTTGTRDHHEAVLFTQEKMKSAELLGPRRAPLLKEYSADFFVWDRCPHCRKLREEGRQITQRYAHGQRLLLEKYLLTDRIAEKPLSAITRADVLDYRSRLAALLGSKVNTANKALAVLKTILKEALFREDLAAGSHRRRRQPERGPRGGRDLHRRRAPRALPRRRARALEEHPGRRRSSSWRRQRGCAAGRSSRCAGGTSTSSTSS